MAINWLWTFAIAAIILDSTTNCHKHSCIQSFRVSVLRFFFHWAKKWIKSDKIKATSEKKNHFYRCAMCVEPICVADSHTHATNNRTYAYYVQFTSNVLHARLHTRTFWGWQQQQHQQQHERKMRISSYFNWIFIAMWHRLVLWNDIREHTHKTIKLTFYGGKIGYRNHFRSWHLAIVIIGVVVLKVSFNSKRAIKYHDSSKKYFVWIALTSISLHFRQEPMLKSTKSNSAFSSSENPF